MEHIEEAGIHSGDSSCARSAAIRARSFSKAGWREVLSACPRDIRSRPLDIC